MTTNTARRRAVRAMLAVGYEDGCPKHDPEGHRADEELRVAAMFRRKPGGGVEPKPRPADQGRRRWPVHGRARARRLAARLSTGVTP